MPKTAENAFIVLFLDPQTNITLNLPAVLPVSKFLVDTILFVEGYRKIYCRRCTLFGALIERLWHQL